MPRNNQYIWAVVLAVCLFAASIMAKPGLTAEPYVTREGSVVRAYPGPPLHTFAIPDGVPKNCVGDAIAFGKGACTALADDALTGARLSFPAAALTYTSATYTLRFSPRTGFQEVELSLDSYESRPFGILALFAAASLYILPSLAMFVAGGAWPRPWRERCQAPYLLLLVAWVVCAAVLAGVGWLLHELTVALSDGELEVLHRTRASMFIGTLAGALLGGFLGIIATALAGKEKGVSGSLQGRPAQSYHKAIGWTVGIAAACQFGWLGYLVGYAGWKQTSMNEYAAYVFLVLLVGVALDVVLDIRKQQLSARIR